MELPLLDADAPAVAVGTAEGVEVAMDVVGAEEEALAVAATPLTV